MSGKRGWSPPGTVRLRWTEPWLCTGRDLSTARFESRLLASGPGQKPALVKQPPSPFVISTEAKQSGEIPSSELQLPNRARNHRAQPNRNQPEQNAQRNIKRAHQ